MSLLCWKQFRESWVELRCNIKFTAIIVKFEVLNKNGTTTETSFILTWFRHEPDQKEAWPGGGAYTALRWALKLATGAKALARERNFFLPGFAFALARLIVNKIVPLRKYV